MTPLYHYTIIPLTLYQYTIIPLYRYTVIPLYRYTIIQLYHFTMDRWVRMENVCVVGEDVVVDTQEAAVLKYR